ncbi:hypothetical protein SARC_12299, partial [Sphaeroforma arctica JP610]
GSGANVFISRSVTVNTKMKIYLIFICIYLTVFPDEITGLRRKRQRDLNSEIKVDIASDTAPNIDASNRVVSGDSSLDSLYRERRGGNSCDLCGEGYDAGPCDYSGCDSDSNCYDTCETCGVCTQSTYWEGSTYMHIDISACTGRDLERVGPVNSQGKAQYRDAFSPATLPGVWLEMLDGDDYITVDKHDWRFKKNCGYKKNKNNKNEEHTCRQIIKLSSCGQDKPTCAEAGCNYGYKNSKEGSSECTNGECVSECCADQPTCSSAQCTYGYNNLKTDATTCFDCASECCAPQSECSSAGCQHGYANNKNANTKCTNCADECCADAPKCASAGCDFGYKDGKGAATECLTDCGVECCALAPTPTCSSAGCDFGYKAGKDASTDCLTDCEAECCTVPPTCASVSCEYGFRSNKNAQVLCTEPICSFECCEPPTCSQAQGLSGHECNLGSVYSGDADATKCEFPRNFNTVCCKQAPCTTGDFNQVLEIYPSCIASTT